MDIKEYQWYLNGKNYNRRLEPSFYDLVDCNWDFFYGKQWRGAKLDDELPQPVFNNINRFVTFFVASIMASKPAVNITSPIKEELEEGQKDPDEIIMEAWNEFEERVKLTWETKNALYDGAVTGDYVGHLIFTDEKPYDGAFSDVIGQIDFERIDPNNFYVSNPNVHDVQGQYYVQIVGRDLIKNLKEEAKEQELIQSDNDTEEQASYFGQIEMEGEDSEKATYVITYQKKKVTDDNGNEKVTVMASKCTKDAYVYKDVDLGISLYPVALGNWELQRNTFHGMSFVQAAIPTQIFINRAFAMAMYNTMTTAFPTFIFDEGSIEGITNGIGRQIGVSLRPGESISNIASYLAPGNMSPQVMQMIELAQQYMKDTVGANDALLGNVNPEQASGVSISVSSKQAGIPLENPRSNLYNWLEDLARIFVDMATNLYGERPVIMPTEDGAELIEFDFGTLADNFRMITVDVGPSSYWDELAVIATLDNLLDRQLIEFIDYLERMPDGYIEDKQGLIDKIKEKQELEQNKLSEESEFINSLTPEEQARFRALPPEEQEALFNAARAGQTEENTNV